MAEDGSSRTGGSYQRAYKACMSCRKAKAKCKVELGSNACSRCRREQKDCQFPLQRSAKRRRLSRYTDAAQSPVAEQTQRIVTSRNVSSRRRRTQGSRRTHHDITQAPSEHQDLLGGSLTNVTDFIPTESEEQADNVEPLRENVTNIIVRSSNDAIGVLFTAAEDNDSDGPQESGNNLFQNIEEESPHSVRTDVPTPGKASLSYASPENLNLWSQHRFVRQGWFSAREAITYIDLFFKNLSHLSPVADNHYAAETNHKHLILEEPLLCCTLLMISSRYHVLPGPGGTSRAEFIHQRLWKHCEHLVQRILFGMEKYSTAKTRTMGSINALLLITEWHPRALHFPPETDGWDVSMALRVDDTYSMEDRSGELSRRWREEVFEPAKRSDRMSWSLIGLAYTLAHELGVFEQRDDETSSPQDGVCRQIRRQLYLYATQLSLRVGCTSIFGQTGSQAFPPSPIGTNGVDDRAHHDQEVLLSKWIEITKLLKTTNEVFFAVVYRNGIKKNTLNKRYLSLIEHFEPLLEKWLEDLKSKSLSAVSEAGQEILLVEYHYVRMFVSSMAIQALVERVGDRTPSNIWQDYDFLRNEYAQDFKFINKVRESSCHILTTATKLAENDVLQFCPVRLFLRIVTASIFLLKSISLGSRDQDVTASLDILDRCIEALKTKKADEMHLSTRYGTLIARHVRRFRRSLRIQSDLGVAMASRANIGPIVQLPAAQESQEFPSNNFDTNPASLATANSFGMIDDSSIEAWLAQPFDPYVAPFGFDLVQPAAGLNLDSLDFLWNLPSTT